MPVVLNWEVMKVLDFQLCFKHRNYFRIKTTTYLCIGPQMVIIEFLHMFSRLQLKHTGLQTATHKLQQDDAATARAIV